MARLWLLVPLAALSLLVTDATAAAPIVNSTQHSVNEVFTDQGPNCATGNEAAITGVVSGVLRTLVLADGSVHISGAFHGTNEYDELPTDGVIDATGTFVLTFRDVFFSSGREIHTETLPGTVTDAATGEKFTFYVVFRLMLAPDGTPTVDFLKIECPV
jgi:hypothetical protein